jgi:protein-S-isoprenylcysteine O-methyltransferase Ste14
MFHRISSFFFGILSYLAFFVTLLYFMGWIVGIGVPTTLDAPATSTTWSSIAIDLGLLTMFGLQHSVMARPAFKEWWTKFVPASLERSVYVLCSSVALFALMAFWQPLGGVVWSAQNETLRMAIYGLFAIGWVILFLATFLINHFDLFGLRQVWLQLVDRPYTPLQFGTPLLYRVVRHPLYVGWLLIFWAAPTMTVAHLLLAVGLSAYILIAIPIEERDLMRTHREYAQYRERVPMLLPRLRG